MTKNCLPYYKRYPRDLLEGAAGMGFELKTAYALVLDLIYLHHGRCPDDARYVAGQLECSVRMWTSIRQRLIDKGKIFIDGDRFGNSRANFELENLSRFSEKQSKNVSKRYKSKGYENSGSTNQNQNQNIHSDATHLRVAAPTKKATRLSDDWQPSEADIAFAEKEGRSPEDISREADRFRDYWTSKAGKDATKMDWAGTWRNWIRRSVDSRQPSLALVNGGAYKPRRSMAGVALELAAKYDRLERETEKAHGKLANSTD